MKTITKTLLISLATPLFFGSCEKAEKVEVKKPAIEYVSFARIPVTDLKFDRKLRTITLQLPAVLPDEGLIPAFGLSEDARIVQGLTPTGKLDLSLIDVCDRSDRANREVEVVVANQAGTDSAAYRLVLVSPSGCPVPLERMSNYLFGRADKNRETTEYRLPLKNVYQNFRIRSLRFTVRRAGGILTTYEPDVAARPCILRYDGNYPNHFVTTFGKDILGKYEFWSEISFTTDCDTNRVSFYKNY